MFKQALFENVRDNFKINNDNKPPTKIPTFFGEAPAKQPVPYIIQNSLDYGDTPKTQCRNDYTDFIEFRIYGLDFGQLAFFGEQLTDYLASLDLIEDYAITENKKGNTIIGLDVVNGAKVCVVSREFVYNT